MTTAVKSNTIRPSAWQQWLGKPRVRLWEAIALSLGIDPEQVSREAGAGWAGWEVGVETSNLETDTAEFCSRLKKACSHADVNGGALRLHTPLKPAWGEAISNDLVNHAVGLADFVHWAKLMGWNLPGELLGAADEQKAEAEFTGTFAEVVSNGKAIDWRYWMSMKTLAASQSSRLMVGLDPDVFTSLDHNGPTRNDTSGQRDRARKIERLALNHGMADGTASEWLSWAKCNGFSIHRLFAIEVEGREVAGGVIAGIAAGDQEATPNKESISGATGCGGATLAKAAHSVRRTRTDGLKTAMLAGIICYKHKHHVAPTARALFDWIAANDETGNVEEFNQDTDTITWKRSDGGLSDTTFKSFQGRFTKLEK